MTLSKIQSTQVESGKVLYRLATTGRRHTYKKTYSKRIYHIGHRKFVIWNGFISFVRNAYKGNYVVWEQAPLSCLDSVITGK